MLLPSLSHAAPGDFYVSEQDSIMRYSSSGTYLGDFADTGSSRPYGLAFDTSGNLYAAYLNTNTISKFAPDGSSSIFASGLSGPFGLAFDSADQLYVSNAVAGTIQRFTTSGTDLGIFASGLSVPQGMAFDRDGFLYAASEAALIYKIATDGSTTTLASSVGSSPSFIPIQPAAVPEPSGAMLAVSVGLLGVLRRRRMGKLG